MTDTRAWFVLWRLTRGWSLLNPLANQTKDDVMEVKACDDDEWVALWEELTDLNCPADRATTLGQAKM